MLGSTSTNPVHAGLENDDEQQQQQQQQRVTEVKVVVSDICWSCLFGIEFFRDEPCEVGPVGPSLESMSTT